MTITRASNTGSEATPSSSTTRPGIYIRNRKPPSITPNRWGFKSLYFFYRPIFGRVFACNDRFLECCADVDIASISDGEGERFTKPVPDHLGRNITPPDFRKDRQTALG